LNWLNLVDGFRLAVAGPQVHGINQYRVMVADRAAGAFTARLGFLRRRN
jgi:hypothetical protein